MRSLHQVMLINFVIMNEIHILGTDLHVLGILGKRGSHLTDERSFLTEKNVTFQQFITKMRSVNNSCLLILLL